MKMVYIFLITIILMLCPCRPLESEGFSFFSQTDDSVVSEQSAEIANDSELENKWDPEQNADRVIISVNGETLCKRDVLDRVQYYKDYYEYYYGYNILDETSMEEVITQTIDIMIEELIIKQKAIEYGYDVIDTDPYEWYNKFRFDILGDPYQPPENQIKKRYQQKVEEAKSMYQNSPNDYFVHLRSQFAYPASIYYYPSGLKLIKILRISGKDDIDRAKQQIEEAYSKIGQCSMDELIKEYVPDDLVWSGDFLYHSETPVFLSIPYDQFFFRLVVATLQKPGDTTKPVRYGEDYYLIQYGADLPEGPADYITVKYVVGSEILQEEKDRKWDNIMKIWREESDIIIYDMSSDR